MRHDRIELLLITLTYVVRYLTLPLAAQLLGVTAAELRSLIGRLERQGLLVIKSMWATEPTLPELAYRSGEQATDFDWLANKLKKQKPKLEKLKLLIATRAAATWTGGTPPNLTRPAQVLHDLSVSRIVVANYANWVCLGQQWRGEDYLSAHRIRCGVYVPDVARVEDGRIRHALDFAAGYGAERLRKIDDNCRACDVTYELWR